MGPYGNTEFTVTSKANHPVSQRRNTLIYQQLQDNLQRIGGTVLTTFAIKRIKTTGTLMPYIASLTGFNGMTLRRFKEMNVREKKMMLLLSAFTIRAFR